MMTSRPRHTTFLFGNEKIATATAGQGPFEHTFGGPPSLKGASPDECGGIRIHLLHRFDLSDPAIPIAIPGIRWLPLYYVFDFRANDLGYRMISDEEIVTYFPEDDPNVSRQEEWPDDNYPSEFPRSSIQVTPLPHNPTDLEDAYRWAGVFGIGKLSEHDRAAAKAKVAELMDAIGFYPPETEEEFDEALCSPFLQGKPNSPCLNPDCENRRAGGQPLVPIALMPGEPVRGFRTFGRSSGGVDLIFRICPRCFAIRASNQCD